MPRGRGAPKRRKNHAATPPKAESLPAVPPGFIGATLAPNAPQQRARKRPQHQTEYAGDPLDDGFRLFVDENAWVEP